MQECFMKHWMLLKQRGPLSHESGCYFNDFMLAFLGNWGNIRGHNSCVEISCSRSI